MADSVKSKRRFIYAADIDEPICMIVEPDHQGWYGLNEFSAIAAGWLCDANDICYEANADYEADDIINIYDLTAFVSGYYLEDRPTLENAKYYGYVFDGRNNVVAITYCNDPNETNDPNELPYFVETYKYSPYGEVSIYDATAQPLTQSAIGNPYMFTAREYDPESGLYYYRLRMYDPTIGRFLQTDPIGYYDSMNLYQYCGNNPTNFIDPWGLAHYNQFVVREIMRQGRDSIYNPWKHGLPPWEGGWDFGAGIPSHPDTFYVPGHGIMSATEFANYLAGYLGAYHGSGIGILAMRGMGNWYENQKLKKEEGINRWNPFWGDCEDSIRDINNGAYDGLKQRRRDNYDTLRGLGGMVTVPFKNAYNDLKRGWINND